MLRLVNVELQVMLVGFHRLEVSVELSVYVVEEFCRERRRDLWKAWSLKRGGVICLP